jgi:hypothetical protein
MHGLLFFLFLHHILRMITEVFSFREYAGLLNRSEDFIERCVGDMEKGLLHVDTVNSGGMTLAFYFHTSKPCDQWFWDRYWALGPSVALFWKLAQTWYFDVAMSTSSKRLCNTAALWEDIDLLLGYVDMMPAWMQEEVWKRIRDCVRFAWMAAVVVA